MNKEEIINEAKKNLPSASYIQANMYIVPVMLENPFEHGKEPTFNPSAKIYSAVTFRKLIIDGVAVGWEFDSID